MAEIFAVATRGVGKPDYTREVSSGKERSGMALKYNQIFRAFAGNWTTGDPWYPLIADYNIPAGGKQHLRDSDTNLPLPIIIPAGYTLSIISISYAASQDMIIYAYLDSIACVCLGVVGSGLSIYENKIRELSTTWYDLHALIPHTLDIIAYNRGAAALYGEASMLAIMEAVGTPPWPTEKECVCPHCEAKKTVPVDTSIIVCDGCGKTYIVTRFSSLRGMGG